MAAAIALAVTFYTLGQRRLFEATGTVLFDPQPARPLGNQVQAVVDMGGSAFLNNQEYYQTQYEIIRSARVATAVVKQLNLHRDGEFLENTPKEVSAKPQEVPVDAAARVLMSRLEVDPVKKSRLADVRYRDANPERAQKILNALLESYVQQNLDDVLDSTTSAADWLRGQLGTLKNDLEQNETALHSFKLDNNILSVSIDDQSNMLRAEMEKLNEALTSARARREAIAARSAELAKIEGKDPADLPAAELLNSTVLQTLRQQYVDSLRNRDALFGEGKDVAHPSVRSADAAVSVTREALIAEIRNIKGSVDRDLSATSHEVGALSGLLESAKKRALELNMLEIKYNRLNRTKQNTEKLYTIVLERTKESDLTRMLRVNNIRILDVPRVPTQPVWPRVPINIALGALIGIVLGIAAAIGREQLDRSIKSAEDIEHEVGATFLGILPQMAMNTIAPNGGRRARRRRAGNGPSDATPELIVHDQPTSGMAEASRAIRTNILFMAPDKPHRTLLVTSAAPREGKTTVACCIAIAMSQAGQRVLLVDCDLRRPRMHHVFRRGMEQGVTTAMLNPAGLDFDALQTAVPNLSVLPSGPIPPNPAELLQSEAFGTLLARLQAHYDRIVIDSPPIVAVTDAAILSTRAEGTVLVLRALETSKDLARRALRTLRDVGGRTVGAVLNAADLARQGYDYYYYHYYHSDTDPEQAKKQPPSDADGPRAEA